jgi:hypothetical protein
VVSLLQSNEWPRLEIILGSELKNKILNEENSEKTGTFFVLEIVPKQGVEVLYLLKPEMKFTFGVHESILKRDMQSYVFNMKEWQLVRSKFIYSEPLDRFKYKKVLLFGFVIYFSE